MTANGSRMGPGVPAGPAAGTPAVETSVLADFTRQLGAMVDVGVDILRALRVASQHTGDLTLQGVSTDLIRLLQDGRELHQAMARHPEVFGAFYVEIVRQGEVDGQLGTALLAVADYLERAHATGAKPGAAPGTTMQTNLVAQTMTALGVMALGAAALWSLNSAGLMDDRWLAPIGLAWAGFCLLGGAALVVRVRQSMQPSPALPSLPPKSSDRKREEALGIARSTLMEQDEDQESKGLTESEKLALLDPPEPFVGTRG